MTMTYDAPALGTTPPDLGAEARCAAFLLPADGLAVREARRNVREQFGKWGIGLDDCDTAALVMSELFTNALIHTTSEEITCGLGVAPDLLLIKVSDEGGGHSTPSARKATLDEGGGRGLMLVKGVSDRWGVGPAKDGGGRIVWAVLRLTQP